MHAGIDNTKEGSLVLCRVHRAEEMMTISEFKPFWLRGDTNIMWADRVHQKANEKEFHQVWAEFWRGDTRTPSSPRYSTGVWGCSKGNIQL